jgi:hypothetical protein
MLPDIGTLSGTATDDPGGSGIVLVEIAIKDRDANQWLESDGVTFSPGYKRHATVLDALGQESTGWTYTWTPQPGRYGMSLITQDGAGNEDSTRPWVTFTVSDQPQDVVGPDATVALPAADVTYQLAGFTGFSGSATDDVGVGEVEVAVKNRDLTQWWNGTGWQAGFMYLSATLTAPGEIATDWSYAWLPPAPGDYALLVRAKDTSENPDLTKPWVIFQITDLPLDDVAPNATVTTPTNNQVFAMGTVAIDGDATDNVGVEMVRVAIKNKQTNEWWNGSTWLGGFRWIPGDATLGTPGGTSTTWSYDFTPPSPSDFAVMVRADDTFGNQDPTKPWVNFSVS